ncbi:MAG: GH25 family lysozyme [Amaricoccus sp.]|uniref:glycoside hydrolase family 25 protein n=1 Tax=Amaricoccus sp. TaxID=1872485 RepID=UPI003314E737
MRGFLLVGLFCFLASCGGSDPEAPASRAAGGVPRFGDADPHDWEGVKPWQYSVHGIDVSKYQGDIDWWAARSGGISFAFIKATEGGDYADERFAENWAGAAAAGVPRGAYHFYYFCRTAAEQADWFMQHVPADRRALPPVLDIEWNHKSRTCPYRPDAETVRSEMHDYLQTVARYYGKRPIIYTTVDFYRENELWRIRDYHFWLRSVAGHPSEVYSGQDWAFWQYTGTGLVSGISGLTDINVFAGSPAQWAQWAYN